MLIMVIGAVLMLGVSIFIHELGHLLCGMLVGVKARIFSIGYGKGIWKKRIGETTYQITGIPIGGYVLFKGDQYNKRLKGKQGELLSTPPLKRMIPVLGGPLFNFFLGFLIFFILALMGDTAPGSRVFIDKSTREFSPAYRAGLRTGDRILSIAGKPTETFEDIFTVVGLSAGEELEIVYERENKKEKVKLFPDVYSAGGRPTIGVEPYGERRVVATFTYFEQIQNWFKQTIDKANILDEFIKNKYSKDVVAESEKRKSESEIENGLKSRAISFLNDGDVILKVEDRDVYTVGELQETLGNYQNKEVNITLVRKTLPLLSPWSTEETSVKIPVRGADILEFSNIQDKELKEFSLKNYTLVSYDPKIYRKLSNIVINGKKFENFENLKAYLKNLDTNKIDISLGTINYTASFRLKPIGLLGFRPGMKFEMEKQDRAVSLKEAFFISSEKVYQNVSTSLQALKMIFSGLISAKDSLSGPIGIVQFAGISLEYGWFTYFDFVARISIALMIMNLLPIPVADGGHLVLYLYEAITGKPVPLKIIEFIFKIGFLFLLLVGLFVTFNDVLRLF